MVVIRRRKIKVRGRFAAVARESDFSHVAETDLDRFAHALCESWGEWARTRRFYGPSASLPSVIGNLQQRTARSTDRVATGRDAIASAQLAALHQAILRQPEDKARIAFEAYYLLHVKPIKALAARLGIGRQHVYTLIRSFRRRAVSDLDEVMRQNSTLR